MKRSIVIAVVMIVAVCTSSKAQVKQVGLGEMIGASGMIFSGTVTEARGDLDENGDIVTYTTFRVEVPLRGVAPGTVTIKQFGGSTEAGSMFLPHMRYFSEGEKVLVMLYPPSELGFTSPIGMGQGSWKVADGGMVVGITAETLSDLGDAPNRYGVAPDAKGRVPLTNLINLIQAVTAGGK